MKLVLCLFLFILFLLTLVKIDFRENFDNMEKDKKITNIEFKKKCKQVFKNSEKIDSFLKNIDPNLKGIDCFIGILFFILRKSTKNISKKLEELIKQKNVLVNYYNTLLENGSATKFPSLDTSFDEDKNAIKYTDIDKFDEQNGVFSFDNYIEDIDLVIEDTKTKLIGTGYTQLIKDIKSNYKVETVKDNILVSVMFNYTVDLYKKCHSTETKINELISLIKNSTIEQENFSDDDISKLQISKKNKKFKIKDYDTNTKLIKHIWKKMCKISNNVDFDVKKIDDEIKNLII